MNILAPGRNCWKIAHADRVSFLIDGASYFGMLEDTVCRARENIIILGWDIACNATVRGKEGPREENQITELLFRCVDARPSLEVYLLNWDFAVVYMFERKMFPALRWDLHPRIHFSQDSLHPPLASQHQKIVVVDDSIAFAGGFDIAAERWDTRHHLPQDPRRVGSNGKVHSPIHDVQAAVDGEAARFLGEMARKRWEAVTGNRIPHAAENKECWPPDVKPDMTDVNIGISRTIPVYGKRKEVREVERLYLDSIAKARKYIFLENQYFTSSLITSALAQRLQEPEGPEVLMVLHKSYPGWMENSTMGVLRKKVLARLRRFDKYGRIAVYYPLHKDANVPINIHSKVTVIDDDFLRIGSSNLSNRSMGFDSECDLAIESEGRPELRKAIRGLRDSLLSEHLGVEQSIFEDELRKHGSLLKCVSSLRNGARTLEPIREKLPEWLERMLPSKPFFDPDRPLPLRHRFLRSLQRNGRFVLAGLTAAAAIMLIWRQQKQD